MKKIIAAFIAFSLLLDLAACGSKEDFAVGGKKGFAGGTGTAADPYQIGNADQLRYLAEMYALEGYEASCYVLMADIDLGGKAWASLGTDAKPFTGTFDGNGFTVSNFKIRDDSPDVGFFGKLLGTVRDLTVADAQISSSHDSATIGAIAGDVFGGTVEGCRTGSGVTVSGKYHVGGIVGNTNDTAVIRNCENNAEVTGEGIVAYAGGIIARAACPLEGCVNNGNISSPEADAAGIAVSANMSVVGCVNTGTVTAEDYAAGIVARFSDGALNHSQNDASVTLLRCENRGDVTSLKDCAAGIAVSCRTGSVVDCVNRGDIRGAMQLGGIVGYFQISSFGGHCELFTVSGCENHGTVTAVDAETSLYGVGGIIGRIEGQKTAVVIDACVNTGAIVGASATGGIVGDGEFLDIKITSCVNSGAVLGAQIAGGILGGAEPLEEGTSILLIDGCDNSGSVYADAPKGFRSHYYCGGILGHCDVTFSSELPFASAEILNCENTGSLSGAIDRSVLCIHDLCGTWARQD